MPTFPQKPFPEKRAFQRSLLRWYARHKRDLPWRRNRDPYRILVSEFMLQQTRVETVLPYFGRFLRTFPTIKVLAKASLQSVLRVWAGLGYYARARHLHAAAKIICTDLGGKIPSLKKDLLFLPGFGPYIAGAVASIAFDEPAAALDGNVRRVLSRLLNGPGVSEKKRLERFLENLIPLGQASDFNQALMDLGALICIPGQPRCPQCPVKKFCYWRATNPGTPSPLAGEGEGGGDFRRSPFAKIEDQNKNRKKKKIRKEVWAIALVEQDGRFFLHRKEGRGLLAGLWQFPTVVLNGKGMSNESEAIEIKGEQKEASQERETLKKALKENFGLRVKIKSLLPNREHQFTHLNVTMEPFLCYLLKMLPCDRAPKDVRWVKPSNLSRYPISRAMDKIAADLLHRIALIEKAGTGIRRMREDARKHKCPEPKFTVNGFFTATFWPTSEIARKITPQVAGQITEQVAKQVTVQVGKQVTREVTGEVGPYARKILELCIKQQPMRIISGAIGIRKWDNVKPHLTALIKAGLLEMTIPDKPRSSKQSYRTTDLGHKILAQWKGEMG